MKRTLLRSPRCAARRLAKARSTYYCISGLPLVQWLGRSRRGHEKDMLTTEQFIQYLREALNHLYDPEKLGRSPLATLFNVPSGVGTPLVLRRTLTDAIESLKPAPDVAPHSPTWRVHQILLYRYVQQFTQRDVADQMGLSVRHLRRQQELALEALASRLWAQFELEARSKERERTGEISASAPSEVSPSVDEELAWLRNPPLRESDSLAQVLTAVLDLAEPMATQHGVHLEMTLPDDLPHLAVHSTALRQALLSLLTVAMHRAPRGQLLISAETDLWAVEIQILAIGPRPGPKPVVNEDMASLDMARRLARMYGGDLTFPGTEGAFAARLRLPSLGRLPVLVIDDNEDTLQLLKRYASGTRYNLVGTRDPQEAFRLLEEELPRIIVLDVMMPSVDGWELLRSLQQHPTASHMPIIVCTVLPQRELAFSLGASDFVRKPVGRQTFLDALDRQALPTATGSR